MSPTAHARAEGWTRRGTSTRVWYHAAGKVQQDASGMWVATRSDGVRLGVFVNLSTAKSRVEMAVAT